MVRVVNVHTPWKRTVSNDPVLRLCGCTKPFKEWAVYLELYDLTATLVGDPHLCAIAVESDMHCYALSAASGGDKDLQTRARAQGAREKVTERVL